MIPTARRCRGLRHARVLDIVQPLFATLVFCCGLLQGANADADADPRVDQIKAAFILNIARFVSWPPSAELDNGVNLCLYRADALGTAVETITGKLVAGQPLRVLRIGSLDTSRGCQVLLVPGAELDIYTREIPASPQPMLTIADLSQSSGSGSGRVRDGVMVALVRKGNHLGLEVNLGEVQRARLTISSQLLKLAVIVDQGGRP